MNDGIKPTAGALRLSDSFAQIATALAAAQGQFANPLKDKTAKVKTRTGGEYSFNYADLASVFDAIRQPLSINALALVQAPRIDYLPDNVALVTVTTRLIHGSGEWLECDVTMGADEQRPQVVSSAITYAKRYGLQALLGVVADEDDDGNAATGNSALIDLRARAASHPGSDIVNDARRAGKEAPTQAAPKAQPSTASATSSTPGTDGPRSAASAATSPKTSSKPAPQRYEEACETICQKIGQVRGNQIIADIRKDNGGVSATPDQKLKILAELEKAALVIHD